MNEEAGERIFQPINELEIQLLSVKAGQISPRAFITFLFTQQVYLLSSEPVDMISPTLDHALYISDDQQPTRLAIFSSRKRAEPWIEAFPTYANGAWMQFTEVLRQCQPGSGIMLNPGQPAGLAIPPEGVTDLRRELGPG